jgi:hypothetical protein
VNFNASITQQTRVYSAPMPFYGGYYGYGYGYYGAWALTSLTSTSTYEGTLKIDIVDAKRKQLVWEGVAVGTHLRKGEEGSCDCD